MRLAACIVLFLAIPFQGFAQPVITDIFNAANRIQRGLPGWGIAPGSVFAVRGRNLGPKELTKASFPLPVQEGLGGVTVTVQVGDTVVGAILVLAIDQEVHAILPSNTPLGSATVKLRYDGGEASGQVQVVASAFGLFNINYFGGPYQTAAFNVAEDGSTSPNDILHPAAAGQTVLLLGTGLGAIVFDETQPGATDTPKAPEVRVFVGTKPAELRWARRDPCCEGLPDVFPLPRGLAAVDVLEIVIPDDVAGCHMSVGVQVGSQVSNQEQIAVADGSGTCADPNAVGNGETVTVSGAAKVGSIGLLQTINRTATQLGPVEVGTEVGVAQFIQFDVGPNAAVLPVSAFGYLANNPNPGSCAVLSRSRSANPLTNPLPPPQPTADTSKFLDAGAAVSVASGSRTIALMKNKQSVYAGPLGASFVLPGVPPTNTLLLQPGTVKASNGGGGADVPAFEVVQALPAPALQFDNIDQLGEVTRVEGMTIRWSGGDPDGYVTITGSSSAADPNGPAGANLSATFYCSERASVGRFTVPAFVLMGLPATTNLGLLPASGLGNVGIASYVAKKVEIAPMDIAVFATVRQIARGMTYR